MLGILSMSEIVIFNNRLSWNNAQYRTKSDKENYLKKRQKETLSLFGLTC